ncbi:hypothetical protein EZS27_004293 [termite gut metagenome]|uniref:Uncharacterized protein n=1 Tax=termite gut metagenome TaxID=433724 RepID=A0A5J4SSU9_9ZZZZ
MNKEVGITDKIKTFEDACKALGLDPENLPIVEHLPEKDRRSIIAHYKLTIIIRALNEGWEPNLSDRNEYKYYNWFYVSDSFAYANPLSAKNAVVNIGFRLCFKNATLTKYAYKQFKDLYLEYLFIDIPSKLVEEITIL